MSLDYFYGYNAPQRFPMYTAGVTVNPVRSTLIFTTLFQSIVSTVNPTDNVSPKAVSTVDIPARFIVRKSTPLRKISTVNFPRAGRITVPLTYSAPRYVSTSKTYTASSTYRWRRPIPVITTKPSTVVTDAHPLIAIIRTNIRKGPGWQRAFGYEVFDGGDKSTFVPTVTNTYATSATRRRFSKWTVSPKTVTTVGYRLDSYSAVSIKLSSSKTS
jgi:hypothetical protein